MPRETVLEVPIVSVAVETAHGQQAVPETVFPVSASDLDGNGVVGALDPVQRALLPEQIHPPFVMSGEVTEERMGDGDHGARRLDDGHDIPDIGIGR